MVNTRPDPSDVAAMMERVKKGAAFLDQYYGHGNWRGQINVETLNINSQQDCVLAQLNGHDYYRGTESLGIDYVTSYSLGFAPGDGYQGIEAAPVLTEAWKQYLSPAPELLADIRGPNAETVERAIDGQVIGRSARYDLGHWERGMVACAIFAMADDPNSELSDLDRKHIHALGQILNNPDGDVSITITAKE